jgi:tetratricopeptide (TPR) repeat protein
MEIEDHAGAAADAQAALKLAPGKQDAVILSAKSLRGRGDLGAAIRVLDEAALLKPTAAIIRERGHLYAASSQYVLALRDYRNALALASEREKPELDLLIERLSRKIDPKNVARNRPPN